MFRLVIPFILLASVNTKRNNWSDLMVVLVNRVQRSLVLDPRTIDYISNIDHHYLPGDIVDVTCVSLNSKCIVQINYDFFEHRFSSYQAFDMAPLSSPFAVGINNTLRVAHNNSRMSCMCDGKRYRATVIITFMLQSEFNDLLSLTINGLPVRKVNREESIYYYYNKGEHPIFECEVNNEHYNLTSFKYPRGESRAYVIKDTTVVVRPETYHSISCASTLDKTTDLKNDLMIFFKALPEHYADTSPLSITTSENRDLLTLYEYGGDQLMVYEFVDGERITFNCSTLEEYVNEYGYYLNFNGNVGINKSSIINKQFTSTDDNTTLECYLNKKARNVRQIIVLFRRASGGQEVKIRTMEETVPVDSSSSPSSESNERPSSVDDHAKQLIIIYHVVPAAAMCLIVTIFIVMYYLKRRKYNCVQIRLDANTGRGQHPPAQSRVNSLYDFVAYNHK